MIKVKMTLDEIAAKTKRSKSSLNYYNNKEFRLLDSAKVATFGTTDVYDFPLVRRLLKKIDDLKSRGYKLKDMKPKL